MKACSQYNIIWYQYLTIARIDCPWNKADCQLSFVHCHLHFRLTLPFLVRACVYFVTFTYAIVSSLDT